MGGGVARGREFLLEATDAMGGGGGHSTWF